MNIRSIDFRLKLGVSVEIGFRLAPVKDIDPLVCQFPHVIEVCAVSPAAIGWHFMPGIGLDAVHDTVDRALWDFNIE